MTAPIRDMASLVRGIREAIEERELACETVDVIAGLPARYTTKVVAPNGGKGIGPASFEGLLGALGKCLIMVDDPETIPKVKNRWVKRKRVGSIRHSLSMTLSIQSSAQEMLEFKAKQEKREHMKAIGKKGGKRRLKTMGKRARQRVAAHAARARWNKRGALNSV